MVACTSRVRAALVLISSSTSAADSTAALPAVNRLHARQDIDAGSQLLLDQAMGDAFGLLAISAGGENNLKIGHMFTKYGSFYQA